VILNDATRLFIETHLNDDIRQLALKNMPTDVDKLLALCQIEARQILSKKVPSWASNPDLLFPKHLSLEQCSSELTAKYKKEIITQKNLFVDLTGGLGIDSYFLSENFQNAYYVENQKELCDLAENNFHVLGRKINVINKDAESFLNEISSNSYDSCDSWCKISCNSCDSWCIFVDPARRDAFNRKMVSLHDCSPDVVELQDKMLSVAEHVLIKASPMLDISLICNELKNIKEIHVVSVKNECKEILVLLERGFSDKIKFVCVDLRQDLFFRQDEQDLQDTLLMSSSSQFSFRQDEQDLQDTLPLSSSSSFFFRQDEQDLQDGFVFSEDDEKSAVPSYASAIKKYLYEPNSSLMKAGVFKLVSQRFNIDKLHVNSHLYTSDSLIPDFPGRVFEVVGFSNFDKKVKKELLKDVTGASVITRNFPLSANDLRKNLNLQESDDNFVVGTTMKGEKKVLLLCKRTLNLI